MRLRDKEEISIHESGIQACGAKKVRFSPGALTRLLPQRRENSGTNTIGLFELLLSESNALICLILFEIYNLTCIWAQ
jgi:hypothetical protein